MKRMKRVKRERRRAAVARWPLAEAARQEASEPPRRQAGARRARPGARGRRNRCEEGTGVVEQVGAGARRAGAGGRPWRRAGGERARGGRERDVSVCLASVGRQVASGA